jgi:ribosomal protein S18 acetylase RimI-like enzyme
VSVEHFQKNPVLTKPLGVAHGNFRRHGAAGRELTTAVMYLRRLARLLVCDFTMPTPTLPQDDPNLENPVYAALSGAQARFAKRSGRVLRYAPDVAPFLALPAEPSRTDWSDALELVAPGAAAAAMHDGSPPPVPLAVTHAFELVQMTAERTVGAHDPEAVTLGPADVPEMLELVALTEPGPFLARTIELGRYVGIRDGGVLVAMGGERMHFDGWTEISAVCTAPAYRGQGLASRLVSELAADIQRRSEHVFLHVLTANSNAIGLYEELGFHARRTRKLSVLQRASDD